MVRKPLTGSNLHGPLFKSITYRFVLRFSSVDSRTNGALVAHSYVSDNLSARVPNGTGVKVDGGRG